MAHFDRDRIRWEAEQESQRDDELEARIVRRVARWKRGAIFSGIALLMSSLALVPFLNGGPLHHYWADIGKRILLLSGCLMLVFVFVAATTYNLSAHLRATKRIHGQHAPAGKQYRKGPPL
jgi:hypothetical protein